MISELKFYEEIFDDFICMMKIFQGNETWKAQSIIKLMNVSKEIENKNIIEEGLKVILTINKFVNCGDLFDSYETESYSINESFEFERQYLGSVLKAEFT